MCRKSGLMWFLFLFDVKLTAPSPHNTNLRTSLVSGPSGLRDYRAHQPDYPHAVGIGDRSHETTSELGYLTRNAPGVAFPLAKNGRIGEIGWPVEAFKIVKGI